VAVAASKAPLGRPRLATAEIAALRARGDSLLGVGDITSARLFYERASDAGDGRAALRLGATYDPGFLDRVHLPLEQEIRARERDEARRAAIENKRLTTTVRRLTKELAALRSEVPSLKRGKAK